MTTLKTPLFILAAALLMVCALSAGTNAAQLSEHLKSTLNSTQSNETVSVLVFMREQFNSAQSNALQKMNSVSRQAAHESLMNELQAFASTRQMDLRSELASAQVRGEVVSYESYWIANAFQIKASKAYIESLSGRSDVAAIIEDLPLESLYNPNQLSLSSLSPQAGVSANLRAIGADSLWKLGYTGAGRLIASFDTGIDGTHPALSSRWRGLTHTSAESWYDPIYHQTTPHIESSLASSGHGTATMGVMVGKDDATGDTVGIAFGAEWISAMVVDIPEANYLEAFQWVADPDGDPSTVNDVPDVLNNSWGFKQTNIDCSDIFWAPIDNLEALGTVVVFACGNEGPALTSIRNPANRVSSPLNSFSVGATMTEGDSVWSRSSRGPSDCDGVSIKPEIAAPGVAIRTASPGGGYGFVDGTSFAAPHVAGAVALLRQYNPNATVEQIKAALMNSATDLGPDGEDNFSGRGLLNLPAALALIPANTTVNVFVQALQYSAIEPGSTVPVVVTLKNSGVNVNAVNGELQNAADGIVIVQGNSGFGSIANLASANNNADPFVLEFDNGITDGTLLSVDLIITGSGGYQKTVKLYFHVGEELVKTQYTHTSDSVKFTVTNYGTYGLAANSTIDRGGSGFQFPATSTNNLYQSALLIGNSPEGVSDGMSNTIFSVDADFAVAPGGNLQTGLSGALGDEETYSKFTDSDAYLPMGITVEQRTAAFDGSLDANYIVMEYTIHNDQDTAMNNIYVGFYCDWDFPAGSGAQDRTGFSRANHLGYMWHQNQTSYRGTAVLTKEGATTFFAIPNVDWIYDGVPESSKYEFLTHGFADTASFGPIDQSYCIATGPFNLPAGGSDTAAFTVIAGRSVSEINSYAARARDVYRQATPVEEDEDVVLPKSFGLDQNYPNPFNPVTRIDFSLAKTEQVTIEVFNSLGQRVGLLLNEVKPAGIYSIYWNGLNDSGEPVASGIYFYKLSAGEYSQTRKMMLLK